MLLGIVASSVEIEWHGGHSTARCFTLNFFAKVYIEIDNLRSGEAIRGKRRNVGWEG
jgi:hypothetical protein